MQTTLKVIHAREDNMKMMLIKVNSRKSDNCKNEPDTCEDESVQKATVKETHQNRSTVTNKVRNYE